MKKRVIISLLFLFVVGLSQVERGDTLFIYADSISGNGYSPDTQGWRFHPGDSLRWAMPDYDDSSWSKHSAFFNKSDSMWKSWTGVGWFRKKIYLDSAFASEPVMLKLITRGAAELYWDGKRLAKYGHIGKNAFEDTLANNYFGRPIFINVDSAGFHTVAVRYAYREKGEWYEGWFDRVGFIFSIGGADKFAFTELIEKALGFGINSIISGLFLSLFILYLLLFVFYSRKVENLYYSIFTLSIAVVLLLSVIHTLIFTDFGLIGVFKVVQLVSLITIFVSFLGFLYSIFYPSRPRYFRYVVLVGIAIVLLTHFFPHWKGNAVILGVFTVLLALEGLRVIFSAISQRQKNAWIIGVGVLFFVILILIAVAAGAFSFNLSGLLGAIILFSGLFSLPLTMSIYLAKTIAETNEDLERQLETVKELSVKEIKQQKRMAEMAIKAAKEKAEANEAKLRAEAAELQAKAAEAESRALRAENERKTKELEAARRLQLSMLPQKLPSHPDLDIAVYMKTATEVGGDYYDFHLSKNGELTAIIGDATGHGLNAGMVVTATKSLINAEISGRDLPEILSVISGSLKAMNFGLLFMSLQLVRIKENKLRFVSAGMPPALLHRGKENKVEELLLKSLPLGSNISSEFKEIRSSFEPGDTLFLYSDGFPELFSSEKEMFGYDKVKQVFASLAGNSPSEIISRLSAICDEWSGGDNPNDDITFVVIQKKR